MVILGAQFVIVSKIMKKLIIIPIILSILFFIKPSSAEAEVGPRLMRLVLPGNSNKHYKIPFKVDKVARFIGAGEGGQTDYFVYNPNGTLIAYDLTLGSNCNIEFVPNLPGFYYILMKNYSSDPSDIVVRTN